MKNINTHRQPNQQKSLDNIAIFPNSLSEQFKKTAKASERFTRDVPAVLPNNLVYGEATASNIDFGIREGDYLVFKINATWKDIKSFSICIVEMPNGETLYYAANLLGDDSITLHDRINGDFLTFKQSEITLIGIVIRVERDLEGFND